MHGLYSHSDTALKRKGGGGEFRLPIYVDFIDYIKSFDKVN